MAASAVNLIPPNANDDELVLCTKSNRGALCSQLLGHLPIRLDPVHSCLTGRNTPTTTTTKGGQQLSSQSASLPPPLLPLASHYFICLYNHHDAVAATNNTSWCFSIWSLAPCFYSGLPDCHQPQNHGERRHGKRRMSTCPASPSAPTRPHSRGCSAYGVLGMRNISRLTLGNAVQQQQALGPTTAADEITAAIVIDIPRPPRNQRVAVQHENGRPRLDDQRHETRATAPRYEYQRRWVFTGPFVCLSVATADQYCLCSYATRTKAQDISREGIRISWRHTIANCGSHPC